MSKLPLVLETLCGKLENRFLTSEPLVWVNDQPTDEDLEHILEQGKSSSQFDPLGLRAQTLEDLRIQKAKLIVKSCEYAKILAVIYDSTAPINWELFAKIFQAFGKPKNDIWRVVWFANPTRRQLPPLTSIPLGPSHVNGGYARACQPQTVVIYREEEFARVLIHELLHAACTDSMDDPVHLIEAKTESWAELFLIAILSGGKLRKATKLWKVQSQWIADQEYILQQRYKITSPADYIWRYTRGRKQVLEDMGVVLPPPTKSAEITLRLTHSLLCV